MSALPDLPEYLPARMLNEFVYCPRLFYYEWVEGVFAHNQETVEGAIRHAGIDSRAEPLSPAETLTDTDKIHARSVTLSSDNHHLIATLDIVEAEGQNTTPVDYKRGAPCVDRQTNATAAWDPDRVQIAVQALVLRDNGYTCQEGVVYYVKTKQRVRVPIDDSLIEQTLKALTDARLAAANEQIPPPLADSPKCPRCSLVGICLPDETRLLARLDEATPLAEPTTDLLSTTPDPDDSTGQPRMMFAASDDLKPLYLNTQGFTVGKSGNVLRIKEKDKVVQEIRMNQICQLNLFGNIQLSTQALQTLCEHEIPIGYFSQGGWFYGMTHGLGVKNIALRREQFRTAEQPEFALAIARSLVSGKIRNQRTMLQRNHVEPPAGIIAQLKNLIDDAEKATVDSQLLGIEGMAAKLYFEAFPGLIKVGDSAQPEAQAARNGFNFNFTHRNRRPPADPVNALLSLAYSVLAKDLTIVCHAVGFDPFLGYYHKPRFGRAPLALDLMEPFRPLIADSAVLSAINTRMITPADFIRAGSGVALKPDGRKAFFRAYEQRMDTLVTHPIFGYRLNYRRLLEIQARLLARVVTKQISKYPVFVTR